MLEQNQYTEDNIRSLDWKEHIRMRPGMYIGKLGDGSSPDDGIYILLKEVIDNCSFKTAITLKLQLISLHKPGRICFELFVKSTARRPENVKHGPLLTTLAAPIPPG